MPIIAMNEHNIAPVPLTKEMFFEEYGMGKANLSKVPRPDCLQGTVFLKAPEAYMESKRLREVTKYSELAQWENKNRFDNLLRKMTGLFGTCGASVSIVNARYQDVKHQIGLRYSKCVRQLSLDAHAILSRDFFVLLDATKDWRTAGNPLVKAAPFIKYYAGVPLLAPNGQAIGVLAIFDAFPRDGIDKKTIMVLQKIAAEIMGYMESQDESKKEKSTGRNSELKSNADGDSKGTSSSNQSSNANSSSKSSECKVQTFLEQFGRATASSTNSAIIFEQDGSGNSYLNNTQLIFSRYYKPYDDIIDMSVWKQLRVCKNMRVASNFLSRLLVDRLNFSCVYIVQIEASRPARIGRASAPKDREMLLDHFRHKSEIENCGRESFRFKIMGIQGQVQGIDSEKLQPFHIEVLKTEHGVIYRSPESRVTFRSGLSMPFFRTPVKIVTRSKKSTTRSSSVDLYIRHGGYIVSCFNTNSRPISQAEIGYIYGCASIIRRFYLMK